MLCMVAARSLADDLALDHAGAVAAPALQQPADHAHRLDDLGIAQAHLGEAVILGSRARWLRSSGPRTSHSLISAMMTSSTARAEREEAEHRMQQENDADIDRRPRQIENGVNAAAGDELAERVEVAQQLAAATPKAAELLDGGRNHAPGHQPVEPHAGAGEHPGAHHVEPRERAEGHQQRDVSMTSVTWLPDEMTRS